MFDPYHKWLGIPSEQRPPTLYQLLGIAPGERDGEVIEEAAIRQSAHVRIYQAGAHAEEARKLLGEIAQARATLVNPAKRQEYDARLNKSASAITTTSRTKGSARAAEAPAAIQMPATATGDGAGSQFDVAGAYAAPSVSKALHAGRKGVNWLLVGAIGCIAIVLVGGGLSVWLLLRSPRTPEKAVHVDPSTRPQAVVVSTPPKTTPEVVTPTPPKPPEVKNDPPVQAGHQAPIACVALSPNGRYAVTASSGEVKRDGRIIPAECTLRLWEIPGGKEVRQFEGHTAPIHAVAFSPDSRWLLSGSGKRETHNGKEVPIDCCVRLWDVQKGKEVYRFNGHTAPVRGVGFVEAGLALSVGEDGTMRLWDTDQKIEVRSYKDLPAPCRCMALAPDGQHVLLGTQDGTIVLWDQQNAKEVRRFESRPGPVNSLAFSANGRQALSTTGVLQTDGEGKLVAANCVVRLWDVASGKEVRRFEGHTGPVLTAVFTPDGRVALSGSADGTVRIWDVQAGKELRSFKDFEGPVRSVAIGPDGLRALASNDRSLRVWDLPADLVVAKLPATNTEPAPSSAKLPVPDEEAQAKAETVVREVFKAEYAKTRAADMQKLAELLMKRAQATTDEPAARYVLLRESYQFAVRAGDADLALQAAGEMDRDYAIKDGLELKFTALDKVNAMPSPPASNKKIILESALLVVDEAAAADDYALAEKLLAIAETAARKLNVTTLTARVTARTKKLAEEHKDFEVVAAALETLKNKPSDPAANLTVGKYYGLAKGNWDKGLPRLVLCGDSALQGLARRELTKPAEPMARAELGDAWWDAAGNERGATKTQMQRRAYHWYKQAVADLTGLRQDQVAQRLKVLSEQLPEQPGRWEHLDLGRATVMKDFVRVHPRQALKTRETYSGEVEITVVARTQKDHLHLNAGHGAAVIFNDNPSSALCLRICRADGKFKLAESGTPLKIPLTPLKPNTWYKIVWTIKRRGMEVTLNGKPIFQDPPAKYDLADEEPIQVRAMDSAIDIQSLTVKPLN
jgi:WD40 repeat protein